MKTPPSHFRRLLQTFGLAAALSAPVAWAEEVPLKAAPSPTNEYDGPVLPEFNFMGHGQGLVAQLCRELEAKAGPKTRIFVSEAAGKLPVPDLALKNVTAKDVLDALREATSNKITYKDEYDARNEHPVKYLYWVIAEAPASAIVCHVYRLPDLPLDAGGGAGASQKRMLALKELFETIQAEALGTVQEWQFRVREVAQENWPSAPLTMVFHPTTRMVIGISTSENLEVLSLIMKAMGGEDIGSVQPPAAALARNAREKQMTVSDPSLPPVATQLVEPVDPSSHFTDFIQIPPGSTSPPKQGTVAPEVKPAQK